MNRITITSTGAVYTVSKIRCYCCDKAATTVIIPDWTNDFYVCDKCKPEIMDDFLSHLPGFTNK